MIEKIGMGTKPDPNNFTILCSSVVNGNTIIIARYHGCTTFDGRKLMVLKGRHHQRRQTLDPHFFEGHPVIGRFIPTVEGMKLAIVCAKNL